MSIEWGLNNNLFNQAKLRISSDLLRLISVAVIMFVCQFGMFANDNTSDIADNSSSSDMKSGKSKDLTIEYNVVAEFNISPLIVSKDFLSFSLGGNAGFGVRFNERYLVGLIFGAGYYTLGALPSDLLNGAELVFRWTIYGATRFTEWFTLYYGVGVSLSFSSYGISYTGYTPATSVGLVLHVEPRFYIPQCRYVDFAVIVDADLRAGNYFTPTVYGGGRVNVHPYITWLSLFAEAGARYEGYQNDHTRLDVGHFVLTAGVSLDLFIGNKDKSKNKSGSSAQPAEGTTDDNVSEDKPSEAQSDKNDAPDEKAVKEDKPQKTIPENADKDAKKSKTADKQPEPEKEDKTAVAEKHEDPKQEENTETAQQPETPESEEKAEEQTVTEKTKLVSEMDDETKAQYQELIEELEEQTGAKVVSFSDVLFEPNSDEMLEGSEATLDNVVAMLKENQTMRLNLCGYTNNVGNKRQELRLSKRRVNKVVNYLVLKGIKMSRLEVAAYGGENAKLVGITKENRRVEIRVLEDKQ